MAEDLKLNGQIVKRPATVSLKATFANALGIDLEKYKDVQYTPEEAKKIRQHMTHLSTGAASVLPLICAGPVKCPFAARCPFVAVDKQRKESYEKACAEGLGRFTEPPKFETPVGLSCLVEVNLLNEWTEWYMNEFEVGDNSWVELGMCRELAEIEVMMWRVNNNLAKPEHCELVQDTVVGADREGNPLMRKEEDALLGVKERLNNRKSKLIKLMVGDRQEKYKQEAALKVKVEKDPSSNAALLRTEITSLLVKAKARTLKLAELEGGVINAEFKESEEVVTPEALIDNQKEE